MICNIINYEWNINFLRYNNLNIYLDWINKILRWFGNVFKWPHELEIRNW